MKFRAASLAFVLTVSASAASTSTALEQQFDQNVRPFVTKYCIGCHSGKSPAAQFDLKSYTSMESVTEDFPHWTLLMERLTAKEMPPKPMPAPPADATQKVIAWVQAVRADQIKRFAKDPGPVLVRRLSNAEYDYTIRDLTGQDMHVTKQFPVDPANPAGFDNSGESLTMSPALLNKYLRAARDVSEHMVLSPDSIDFAPYPMLVETDREKYSIQRIMSFYQASPTNYADYFEAAWRYQHRASLGEPHATLASIAASAKISSKYLPMVWGILHDKDAIGPVLKLQKMYEALPPQPDALHAKCVEMSDFVIKIRTHTAMQFATPKVRGLPSASQPLQNWKLKKFAAHHRDSDPADLRNDTDPPEVMPTIPKRPGLHQDASAFWAALSAKARFGDPDLVVPAAERKQYEASFERFANVFPDTFYVTERGRYWPDDSEDKGRLLSAGYHNVMGFYRDDTALMELILDEKGQQELNRLWDEFDFIANITARTWTQFYTNNSGAVDGKGAESGTLLPADHALTDEAVITAMRDKYLAKSIANASNDHEAPVAMEDHFDRINATLRSLEKERKDAEPKHLEALLNFAERAYRRPLTKAERDDLLAYYHALRTKNELSHEDAIRDSVVSILMSPDFLYRLDLSDLGMTTAKPTMRNASLSTAPLSAYALASRLSYFIWSTMPDQELLHHAAIGDLEKPEVLLTETRRMFKDDRVRGFAREFVGNWLGIRQFETNNSVDRQKFPEFNDDLRAAMLEEPVRFFEDLAAHNRSIFDLINGNYTFVNAPLAKQYGIPGVAGDIDNWVRIDDAGKYQRGGLLPMAVFMTEYSPGLRTSPVKRGHWVVSNVLGIKIPPPPPVVPELPADESKSELSVRDLLAKHRSNPVCSGCHAKFDSFGLAFEGYGPVGEARTHDLGGRAVDTAVTYPGGFDGNGLKGLRDFITEHRQKEFVDSISRKLLAYALNRSLQLSDEALIERMESQLAAKDDRFDTLVETIVTSPQFLTRRVDATETHTAALQSRKAH